MLGMGQYQIFDTIDTGLHSDMVSIHASSIEGFWYMRAPHCACAKSTFPHFKRISVMPSGGDSGGS